MRLKTTQLFGFILLLVCANPSFVFAQPSKDTSTTMLQSLTANCNQPPIVICPPDFEACPGASTDPANTGHATGLPANPICSPPMINFSDLVVSTSGCTGSTVIIRTWTATDPQKPELNSSCEQLITLSDTIAPLIIDCPTDIDAMPNGGCFANVFWQQPLVVDNCGRLDLDVSHVSGDRFPIGTTTVTYTATDECGNVSSCSFVITVEGDCCDLPPIITCPGDYTGCPGDTILPKKLGRAKAIAGRPNCDPPAVFYRDDTISTGPCAGAVVVERIWVAVDPHNPQLNATCTQRIELNDVINPFIFGCPADIFVDSDTSCVAIVDWIPPTARDNCEGVKLESNFSPGDTFQIGTTTVIYVATDSCGNRATCMFDVNVKKACCTENPIIECPDDYFACPGTSVDTSITGVPDAEAGGPHCDPPIVRYEETVVSEGPCPGERVLKRLWIAEDPNDPSLRSTCLQFITLSDTTDPTLVSCTSDTTVSPNTGCRATVSWKIPRFTDNCSAITLTSTHQPGDTFEIGNTTVTYTATDACGNSASCSFVVTVLDDCCNKPPVIMCPSDYITCPKKDIDPDVAGRPTWTKGHPTCDDPVITFFDENVSNGPCPNQMRIERNWIATDPNDQSLADTCIQIIELKDEESPIFWECPSDTTVAPNDDCEAIVSWIPPLATDNCGLVSVTTTHEPGDTFQIGTTTVTYTAIDGCGNDTTCSFVVTVTDECCMLPPSITCPADYVGCPGADLNPDFTGRPSVMKSSDFCEDPEVSFADDTISSGPCVGAVVIERTWTATDPNRANLRASCTQTLTLDDKENPVLSNCPSDTSVAPNDDCEAIVSWTRPGIADNCGIRSVSSSHMPGDVFPLGTTTVTYTLTDVCGNTAVCSFTVTVRDECCNKPPVVTCPPAFNGCPGVSTDPANTGSATAAKGHPTCDDPVITSEDEVISSGPCAGATVIRRSWIATDPNNALADTCIQMITLEDNINPTIQDCPNDTTLSPNVDCEAQVFWNTPTTNDNCGTPALSGTHSSGDLFPIGSTTVVLTTTDGCGNTATCSFIVTVLDDCCNKPPVVTCPPAFNGCPGVSTDPANTGSATAAKGHPTCDDPVVTSEDEVISSGPCAGATVIRRSWIATDPNNALADTCIQMITLEDNINPTIQDCPNDTTLSPNVDCEAQVFWNTPTTNDNCGTPALSGTHSSGDLFPIGSTTVVLTTTDGCGNTATCSFIVTVLDDCCNKPPVVTCPPAFNGCPGVSTDPANTGSATAAKGHPTCDDPVITSEDEVISSGPCAGATVIRRSWIATDPNNALADTCIQMITLEDNINPTIQDCPKDTTLSPNVDCEAQVFWNTPTTNDNCGTPALSGTHSSGDLFPIGSTTVVLTTTDGCGNTATCSFIVTVLDDCCNRPPVVTCPPAFNGCPGVSTDPANTGSATAAKGHPTCDDPVITSEDEVISSGPCAGATVIRRSWIATDPNNALADTCIQMITLEDVIDPTLVDCPNDTLATADETCTAEVSWTPPTPSDNCSVVLTSTHQPGDRFPIGITTVTYTATDGCGNTATCSFDVEVDGDNIHIMCPNDTVIVHPGFSFGEYVFWNEPKVTQCNPSCPDSIPGFIYMGERNGHRYFCSEYRSSWNDARDICDSLGGYLAVVNDASENDYLAGLLMGQPAYIGLNDWAKEGDFVWVNGDPLTFTSWATGQPDNKNNYQHVTELYPDGSWEDQFYYVKNEFICEIPCYTVKQIDGPGNGEFFTCGPTTVTYVAEDGNGTTDTCSFVVDVDCSSYKPYCVGRGINSNNYWLNSVKLGEFFKETGRDYGYGDYTASCIELSSGETEKLCLGVGYAGITRNVYWRAWIDYNGDRDFDDQGEGVASGFGNTVVCGDIHVPANLNTRTFMRIAISYGRWPNACGFVSQGEYEDYCVVIQPNSNLTQIIGVERVIDEAIEEIDLEREIQVSPNPARDQLFLTWEGELPSETRIVDTYGRILLQLDTHSNDGVEISVSNWNSGRYSIISQYQDGQVKTKAIMIVD